MATAGTNGRALKAANTEGTYLADSIWEGLLALGESQARGAQGAGMRVRRVCHWRNPVPCLAAAVHSSCQPFALLFPRGCYRPVPSLHRPRQAYTRQAIETAELVKFLSDPDLEVGETTGVSFVKQ